VSFGGFLCVPGFGAAGAEIIAKNMKAGGGDIKDVLTRGTGSSTTMQASHDEIDFAKMFWNRNLDTLVRIAACND
jgi:hypothetical protein